MRNHITVSSRGSTTYDKIVSETLTTTTITLTHNSLLKGDIRAERLKCTVEGQGSANLNGTSGTKWRGVGWMRWNRTDRMELGPLYWIMIKMSNAKILFMFRWHLKGMVCLLPLKHKNFAIKSYRYFWELY